MNKLPLEEWKRNVPLGMRALQRWVGHYAKRPVNVANGGPAMVDNPKTWGTFEQACEFYAKHMEDEDAGAGFVFTDSDGLVFADFDNIEQADEEVRSLLDAAEVGSYSEWSPSGKGVHVFAIGKLPSNVRHAQKNGYGAGVEVYSTGRYSTVTGVRRERSPTGLRPMGPVVDRLVAYLGTHENKPSADLPEPSRVAEVVEALSHLDPDMPYDEWLRIGMALKSGLGEEGRDVWLAWSYEGSKHRPGEPESKWDSFQKSGVGLGTIFHRAKQKGWGEEEPRPAPEEVFKPVEEEQQIGSSEGGLRIIPLATVKPEKIEWLWRGRLALGHLAIIAGDPGKGKSIMTLDISSRISRGTALPGEAKSMPPGRVLYLNAEDGQADTIRPRAEAAGADLDRVFVLDIRNGGRPPQLPDDVPALEAVIDRFPDVKLVILDPINACIPVRLDSHKDQHVRQALQPLAAMAQRKKLAVAIVAHLNKANDAVSTLYRVSGSVGLGAAARSVLFVGVDPEDEDRRVVAQAKPQLGPPPPSLAFGFKSAPHDADVGMVEWIGETQVDADDLTPRKNQGQGSASKVDDAVKWLEAKLGAAACSSAEVMKDGKTAGFGKETLKAAASRLGVVKKKDGMHGPWMWSLDKITEVA